MPSDWLKIVMGLSTANQSTLFQRSIAMPLLKFVYDNGFIFSFQCFLCYNWFSGAWDTLDEGGKEPYPLSERTVNIKQGFCLS